MVEGLSTKELLAKALIELCREMPFAKITVQGICRRGNINRQNFYYHFKDKRDLVCWIYEDDALSYISDEQVTLENWEENAYAMLQAMKRNEHFYYETVRFDKEMLAKVFFPHGQKLFAALFHRVDIDNQLTQNDVTFYARFLSYGCSGVLFEWILSGMTENPIEIAGQLFRLAKDIEFFSNRLYKLEENQEETD